jgi:hypothetical protein
MNCLFGAGQCLESFIAFDQNMPHDKKPALIALYELLTPDGVRENQEVQMAVELYPAIALQIGLELPTHNEDALKELSSGRCDAMIIGLAERYIKIGSQIFLRVGYEFDGPWNGYDPQAYIAAFRHIVRLFRSTNAHNVEFVWNSYICDNSAMYDWYPGDEYVDWFCFNTVTAKFTAGWYMREAEKHKKPVMIGEASYAIVEDGMTFAEWCGQFFDMIAKFDIRAFQYINWEWGVYPKHMNWRDWENGRCTDYPERMEIMRCHALSGRFSFRDTAQDKKIVLAIDCARGLSEDLPAAPWQPEHDHVTATGISYCVEGAVSIYNDGWHPFWEGEHISVHIVSPDYAGLFSVYFQFISDNGDEKIEVVTNNSKQTLCSGHNGFVEIPMRTQGNKGFFLMSAAKGRSVRVSHILIRQGFSDTQNSIHTP